MGSWNFTSTWASLANETISESLTTYRRGKRTDRSVSAHLKPALFFSFQLVMKKLFLFTAHASIALKAKLVKLDLLVSNNQFLPNLFSSSSVNHYQPCARSQKRGVLTDTDFFWFINGAVVFEHTILAASSRSSQARIFKGLAAIRAFASSTLVPARHTNSSKD